MAIFFLSLITGLVGLYLGGVLGQSDFYAYLGGFLGILFTYALILEKIYKEVISSKNQVKRVEEKDFG